MLEGGGKFGVSVKGKCKQSAAETALVKNLQYFFIFCLYHGCRPVLIHYVIPARLVNLRRLAVCPDETDSKGGA